MLCYKRQSYCSVFTCKNEVFGRKSFMVNAYKEASTVYNYKGDQHNSGWQFLTFSSDLAIMKKNRFFTNARQKAATHCL